MANSTNNATIISPSPTCLKKLDSKAATSIQVDVGQFRLNQKKIHRKKSLALVDLISVVPTSNESMETTLLISC
ncbi:hypothetical protein AXFE_34740 [Acidithrix ferrooxidans]|uniref:Uncharacterized protein n=1 Tax=Acidithrix ferrooxidans TaxID=1280514 RepID=A0A0D8HD03_9ACTN|nr:hypothetical protein AXFE_34740 [Acidithrix ferrooxidans]